MNILHRYEGKNLETLKSQCLEELNVKEDEIYIFESEEETGLFKGKKYIIEAITKEEIINQIRQFIKELAKKMKYIFLNQKKRQDYLKVKNILLKQLLKKK